MLQATAATLPWIAILLYTGLRIRFPRPLPALRGNEAAREDRGDDVPRGDDADALPFVSIVVPARNEAVTIETCVRHLAASRYPGFEIIVVDDRSRDETGALARAVDSGGASAFRVVDGEPLPDGWLGKPWACWQGYQEASGELVLFTDADTRHGPDLLERAVAAMEEDDADAVTLMGRQLMESFWEKVVQPQLFVALAIRFPRLDRVIGAGRCGSAAANGQFILLERDAYEGIEGHRSVRGEVVEDLRLAQHLCADGRRISMREAEDDFAIRMYRSLAEIVEGWSKNLSIALRQSVPRVVKPLVLPLAVATGIGLWLVPPLILVAGGVARVTGLARAVGPGTAPGLDTLAPGIGGTEVLAAGAGFWGTELGWTAWSAVVVGLSVLFWMGAAHRSRIHPAWGVLYPLGSVVTAYMLIRSWIRGRTVEWKGRVYRVEATS